MKSNLGRGDGRPVPDRDTIIQWIDQAYNNIKQEKVSTWIYNSVIQDTVYRIYQKTCVIVRRQCTQGRFNNVIS